MGRSESTATKLKRTHTKFPRNPHGHQQLGTYSKEDSNTFRARSQVWDQEVVGSNPTAPILCGKG